MNEFMMRWKCKHFIILYLFHFLALRLRVGLLPFVSEGREDAVCQQDGKA